MKSDLKAVTEGQLAALIARAKQRRTELENETIARVRTEIRKMIESEGLTLSEVLGALCNSPRTVRVTAMRKFLSH